MNGPLRGVLVLVVAVLASVAVTAQEEPAEPTVTERVDEIFSEWDRTGSPGCAVGVIQDGELIHARGYGMANLEHRIAISPRTVFRIGSTSKQFTAAVMALLARDGKISLDDDIRKFFPEMPEYERPVTVRQLIHHTSGLRDYLVLMLLTGYGDLDNYTNEDVVRVLVRQQAPNFTPGSEYLYSNSGYFLQSQIVERVTDQTLREYADEHIFKPLGMRHTHFHDDPQRVVPDRADGYSRKDDGGFEISMTTLEMVGDGGVFTTVEDLLLWDRNFYDNRLGGGGAGFLDTMHTKGTLTDGEQLDYAFGLVHGERRGLPTVSHGGAFVGFRAEMVRFPTERFSVACLCNLAQTNPSRLAREVADVYLEDRYPEPAPESPSGEEAAEDTSNDVELAPEALERLVGTYFAADRRMVRRIVLDDGKLAYWRGEDSQTPLAAQKDGSFRMVGVGVPVRVSFEPAKGEARVMQVVTDDGDPLDLERVAPAEYDPAGLERLAGVYHNAELDVSYTIAVEGKALRVEGLSDPLFLDASFEGFFTGREWPVTLQFHAKGKRPPDSFELSAGRVRNLIFTRQ